MAKARKGRKTNQEIYKTRYAKAYQQYERALVEEQATREILTGLTTSKKPKTLFKHLDFEEIKTYGITRKIGGKYKRITGFEAVAEQIKSLEKRVNKEAQKDQFIENVKRAMTEEGYESDAIFEVGEALEKLTPQQLTVGIINNMFPAIYRIYADKNKDKVVEEFVDSCEAIEISDVGDELTGKIPALSQNIIERWQILEK